MCGWVEDTQRAQRMVRNSMDRDSLPKGRLYLQRPLTGSTAGRQSIHREWQQRHVILRPRPLELPQQ